MPTSSPSVVSGAGGGGGGESGAGAVWRQPYSLRSGSAALSPVECIVTYALTSEACRVSAAELQELEENFQAFKHLEDSH